MNIGSFFRKKSKDVAKQRLMLVLSYERQGLPPSMVEKLKEDLISLFSKYPQFDAEGIDVALKKNEEEREELWISIPFKVS
ncbi:cell division topological specificity factor [Hydrogenivirga caldilitoris]|uniref:Cell division topological specificity factor n=1 Tax=Hydrogenivirga caldilitoris TaxID=246264 RepID=A0A497XVJ6_9AQUI|nr:cell division topological specificity factor MinE [Hydrogenivirga caldilitoris]RLJ71172.1 cell division topological specificity factor [Hydrogenivirga caldilitoris]